MAKMDYKEIKKLLELTDIFEKRLAEMQSPDYEFPPSMDRRDTIAILTSMGICALLMVLCMTGVIA